MAFKPVTKSDEGGNDWLQHATQIVGLLAGTATVIYLAGGLVMALRLAFQGLPWGNVVSQLPREFLVSIGAGQVLLPALLIGALYGVVRLVWTDRKEPPELSRWGEGGDRGEVLRGYARTLRVVVIPPAVVLFSRLLQGDLFRWRALAAIAAAVVVLAIVAVVIHETRAATFNHYRARRRWNTVGAIVVVAAIYSAAAIPSMMAAAASVELSEARVCNVDNYSEQGFLVGETSDRVYLGEKSGNRRIVVIPFAKVAELFIGDEAEHATCEIVSAPPTADERLEIERRLREGISNSFLLPENQTREPPPRARP